MMGRRWFSFVVGVVAWAALGTEGEGSGGREAGAELGLNLAGIADWSTEMPFVDLFRRARAWVPQEEGKPWGQGPKLELSADGYPARLGAGQYATTVISGGGHPAGLYTLLHDGKGELRVWGDVKEVKDEGGGRLSFSSEGRGAIFIDLKATDAADPVRNIRVLMPGFENQYGENPFHPHFLERTGQFRVIRFMDWMDTNNSKVRSWEERPKVEDFSFALKGVPVEVMVDLANRLKVDPWFCMPHLADDEYVRKFARLVRERLDPERKVYVEHSNEVWNGQFEQALFAREMGQKLGLSKDSYQGQLFYHSRRSVQIFRIWEEEFGGKERLVRVLGSQSANPWVSEQVMTFEGAYRQADAVAIAPYFGNGLGDPKEADRVSRMTVEQVLSACREELGRSLGHVRETVAKAKPLGLRVIAYEAGQHLVGHGGAENNEALMRVFHAANRDPRMGELYSEYLRGWNEAGGGLAVMFSSVAAPSKWGSWGLLETEFQDPAEAPKYRAVLSYLRQSGRSGER